MAGLYLDTSALGRIVLDEPDSEAIGAAISSFDVVVSSRLLGVELHRLGLRCGVGREEIDTWLASVALLPIDDTILSAAEAVSPPSVATPGAIHLATALQLAEKRHVSSIMTFDVRLSEGSRQHGLSVLAPG